MKGKLKAAWSENGICSPRVCAVLIGITAAALLFMTLATVADVFGRFAFNSPIMGVKGLCEILQPWVVYTPFAYALITGSHVRVSVLADRVRFRARLATVTYTIDFIAFAFLMYASSKFFFESFMMREIMRATVDLAWWPGKLAAPVGVFFIAAQCLFYISTRAKTVK